MFQRADLCARAAGAEEGNTIRGALRPLCGTSLWHEDVQGPQAEFLVAWTKRGCYPIYRLVCQRVKAKHQRPAGKLQPLPVPEWKWEQITMNFVTGFPRSQQGHDAVWVIVDQLTKSAHFLPIHTTWTRDRLALPPNLDRVHNVFHVSMLWKYLADSSHVLDATTIELREDLSFEETPFQILARENKNLRNRTIPYVKVQWSNHEEREATWELETKMKEYYPELFSADRA